jgi:hypothetical protein
MGLSRNRPRRLDAEDFLERKLGALSRDSFATLPPGAGHSTAFGVRPTHVMTLYPTTEESALLFTRFLEERRRIIAPAAATVGRRLALELAARDPSWGLAAAELAARPACIRATSPVRSGSDSA